MPTHCAALPKDMTFLNLSFFFCKVEENVEPLMLTDIANELSVYVIMVGDKGQNSPRSLLLNFLENWGW